MLPNFLRCSQARKANFLFLLVLAKKSQCSACSRMLAKTIRYPYMSVQIMVRIRYVVTPVFLIYTLFAPFCIKLNFLPCKFFGNLVLSCNDKSKHFQWRVKNCSDVEYNHTIILSQNLELRIEKKISNWHLRNSGSLKSPKCERNTPFSTESARE